MFIKLFKRRNTIFIKVVSVCKNYLETNNNEVEIKNALEKCLEDDECFSDIFNEIIDRIIKTCKKTCKIQVR